MLTKNFPNYIQENNFVCGLTCIKIICKYYNKIINITPYYHDIDKKGISIYDLCRFSEIFGLNAKAIYLTKEELSLIKKPIVLHLNNNHYTVLYQVKKDKYFISDPKQGKLELTEEEFLKKWLKENNKGYAIDLKLTDSFHEGNKKNTFLAAFQFLIRQLQPFTNNIKSLLVIIFVIGAIYAILPFITRSIIDIGVSNKDLDFILILLCANLALLLFKNISEWIKSTITLHLANRIKISIVTDYLIQIFKLPVSTISNIMDGDIIQRAKDQERIQQFISVSAISIFLSVLIILIYSIILFYFNPLFFYIFIISNIIYIVWIMLFYRIRKQTDVKYFESLGSNQSSWIEILKNFEDIKINNYSYQLKWKWELIQNKLHEIEVKLLHIDRVQQIGVETINGLKDLFFTFYGAYLVITGELSIGTYISIQFLIAQLHSPTNELIMFIKNAQSAFISYIRVNEIFNLPSEQNYHQKYISSFEENNYNVNFKNISFRYTSLSKNILSNISFELPQHKLTVIVGSSGSGKSSLFKLLTKTYTNYVGDIYIGNQNIKNIENSFLRNNIGSVFQDSCLYEDTILNNIVLKDQNNIDLALIDKILDWVALKNEVYALPNSLHHRLTEGGKGLSYGQKQRLLLARALYKKPKFLLLDEFTNGLDQINKSRILDLLTKGLKQQTKILITHDYEIAKKADKIIVIQNGYILEEGKLDELINKKMFFYNLFKTDIENDY